MQDMQLEIDTHCHYYQEQSLQKKINIHFYVLESLNYLQRIKVDMVTDEFTPYLSVKI